MSDETTSFSIKPVGFSILLFFALALLLAGVYYATAGSVEGGIRNGAQMTLEQWKGQPPKVGERIRLPNTGWSYIWAFQAGKKGGTDEGIVYALRITGNAGPYTAIFYQTAKQGTQFCGLAGVAATAADVSRYGITERFIRTWISRLDAIAADGENQ
jgi:hypothetical protein